MLVLLESQDLLCFINGTNPSPAQKSTVYGCSTNSMEEIEKPDYLLWRRSDRLVKGWIIGSLSEEILDIVLGLNTARDVWTKLENHFLQDSQEQPSKKENSVDTQSPSERDQTKKVIHIEDRGEEKDLSWYLPLQKATLRGDWGSAKRFFDRDGSALTAKITSNSYTALHIAIGTGEAIPFVEKLVELMPTEALEIQNNKGNTALVVAACVGNTEAAKILVNKNRRLPYIMNHRCLLPIHYAAANANEDLLKYLLPLTQNNVGPNPFQDQSGIQLLIDVIVSELFDVALYLVHKYPKLATLKHQNGDSPLKAIATKASAFRSGTCLNFWESLIYSCVPVKLKNYDDDSNGCSQALKRTCGCWVQLNTAWEKFILVLCRVIGLFVPRSMKDIQKKKLINKQVVQLVRCLCKEIGSLNNHDSYRSHYEVPILLAASLGIYEVVEEIVDTFPNAAWSVNEDNHNIIQIAVIHRCENVFNLIYQMNDHKHYLTTPLLPDSGGNTILHLAGRLAPLHKLNSVSGAALQMQQPLMATNKERMELLDVGLGAVQDGLQRLEIGMADKFQHVETTLNRLSKVLFATQETSHVHHNRDPHPGDWQIMSSKLAKLEFPRFFGDDPTEWLSHVHQFFEFQHTPET
ncbi:hypothetical protein F0562_022489 [Nyssa sinensis]|uniref:Uncharacterized protein n=1 Tax=Nyssa sinensis TaxID=561372 RepID=A0A5J5BT98_9ASTE|nr:hypothetical protein F0562_022489 [Nyssa sinensis]